MERNKIIAAVCAVIAFVLVLVAGKSCTDDAMKQKEQNKKNSTTTPSYNIVYPGDKTYEEDTEPVTYETNVLGMTIIPTTTAVQYDLFGRPITTETETAADENMDTVTTAVGAEPVTAESSEQVTTEPATTIQPHMSGYDHGQYDEDGNPIPTLPPDFVLIIE